MLVVGLSACAAMPARETAHRPHILVVNDDGVSSDGIQKMTDALSKWADVVVVAPDGDRSGAGQSISYFSKPLNVKKIMKNDGEAQYAVSGTPADSAIFGLVAMGKDEPFDLVVSGINKGQNVGSSVNNSGTVGAARQAASMGVSAIAVSQAFGPDRTKYDFTAAADYASRFARDYLDGRPAEIHLYNINVPENPKGVKQVAVGGTPFVVNGFSAVSHKGAVTIYKPDAALGTDNPQDTDTGALDAGYITVSELAIDPTRHPKALHIRKLPQLTAEKSR